MSDLPYMRLYPTDLVGSPRWRVLSDAQRLALLSLIMAQHGLGGVLPSDPAALRSLADVRAPWDEVWTPALSSWFVEVEGGLAHLPTMERVVADAKLVRDLSEAGRKGAALRWGGHKGGHCHPQSPPQCSPSPSPSPSPSLAPTPTPESSPVASAPAARAPAKARAAPTGEHAELVADFCRRFLEATGAPYAVQGAKDGSAASRLLKLADGPERARRMERYFEDSWVAEHGGWTIAGFAAGWNRYAAPKGPPTIQRGRLRGQPDGRAWLEAMVGQPEPRDVRGEVLP